MSEPMLQVVACNYNTRCKSAEVILMAFVVNLDTILFKYLLDMHGIKLDLWILSMKFNIHLFAILSVAFANF